MLANAVEILSCFQSGRTPEWDLEKFRYFVPDRLNSDDPDFDPLADGAQSADVQEAILRGIAARYAR